MKSEQYNVADNIINIENVINCKILIVVYCAWNQMKLILQKYTLLNFMSVKC